MLRIDTGPMPSHSFRDAYLDVEQFQREERRIFHSDWLCAGREEDVPSQDSWFLAAAPPEGILVTRDDSDALHAFHNVCPHRGVPLVERTRGRQPRLVCPYHGWSFRPDGAPCPGTATQRGLLRASVATWQGFVFVSRRADAPPLSAQLDPMPLELSRFELRDLLRARQVVYEVRANWKLLCENFQESLHFPSIHPRLEALTPASDANTIARQGRWLGGTMRLLGDAETVSTDGSCRRRPLVPARGVDLRLVYDFLHFPNLWLSIQPDYVLSYMVFPLGVDRTRIVHDCLFPRSAWKGEKLDASDVFQLWDEVHRQDWHICERQQIGLSSPFYRPGPVLEAEDGVHAFDALCDERMQSELDDVR